MSSANISRVRDCYNVLDRKSTRLNSSHDQISYAVFCLKKKKSDRKSARVNETLEPMSVSVFLLKNHTPTEYTASRLTNDDQIPERDELLINDYDQINE